MTGEGPIKKQAFIEIAPEAAEPLWDARYDEAWNAPCQSLHQGTDRADNMSASDKKKWLKCPTPEMVKRSQQTRASWAGGKRQLSKP